MSLGGIPSMMLGPQVGQAAVKVGADFRGFGATVAQNMAQMRVQMEGATRGMAKGPTTALRQVGAEADASAKRVSKLGLALRGLTIALGTTAIAGIGMAVRAAIQWESAFAGVRKTVEASEDTLRKLEQAFLDLSTKIPVAATELARIGEAAGALGVATEDILEFVKVVSTIGTTTNVSVDEAATALGQLSNVLQLTSDDYSRFAATLVDLGNKGASTEAEILEITRRMGAAAKLFGLATEDILALASSAANLGMQPQLAASSLQRLVMRLNSIVGSQGLLAGYAKQAQMPLEQLIAVMEKGGESAEKLALAVGKTSKQLKKDIAGKTSLDALQGAMEVTDKQFARIQKNNPERIFELMFQGMQRMDSTARQSFIGELMGPQASSGGGVGLQQLMLGLADSVHRNLIPSLAHAKRAWEENTAAQAEAEKRYGTTASAISILQGVINRMFIDTGKTIVPLINEVTRFLADTLPSVFERLGAIWKASLEPALIALWQGFTKVFAAVGQFFALTGGDGATGAAGAFESLAAAVGAVATQLGRALDALGELLSNPIVNGLGKIAVVFGSIALAVKSIVGLKNFVNGLVASMAGTAKALGMGFATTVTRGRYGKVAAPAPAGGMVAIGAGGMVDEAFDDAADTRAATTLTTAGRMLITAAEMLAKASAGLSMAGAADAADDLATIAAVNRIAQRGPGPGVPGLTQGAAAGPNAASWGWTAGALGPVNPPVAVGATGLKAGITGVLRGGANLVKGAVGLAAKAFWPLFIADLVGNLVAAPIGDFIKSSGGSKKVAGAWEKGWMEGISASIMEWLKGNDNFIGNAPSYGLKDDKGDPLGTQVDRSLIESIAAKLGGDAPERYSDLLDTIDAAEEVGDQLVGYLRLFESLAKEGEALVPVLKDMQGFFFDPHGVFQGDLDTIEGFAKMPEMVTDRLRAVVTKGLEQSGFEPGGRLWNLSPEEMASLQKDLKSVAPQGYEDMFRRYIEERYLPVNRAVPPEGVTETIKEETKALREYRKMRAEEFPGQYGWAQQQVQTYGGRFQEADTLEERLSLIRDIFGQELKRKDKDAIEEWWAKVEAHMEQTFGFVGADQQEALSENAESWIANALMHSKVDPKHILPWLMSLVDGVGAAAPDISAGLGDVLSIILADALKDAGGDPTKALPVANRVLSPLLQSLPEGARVAFGGVPLEDAESYRAWAAAGLYDDYERAQAGTDKDGFLERMRKSPYGKFRTWGQVEKFFAQPGVAERREWLGGAGKEVGQLAPRIPKLSDEEKQARITEFSEAGTAAGTAEGEAQAAAFAQTQDSTPKVDFAKWTGAGNQAARSFVTGFKMLYDAFSPAPVVVPVVDGRTASAPGSTGAEGAYASGGGQPSGSFAGNNDNGTVTFASAGGYGEAGSGGGGGGGSGYRSVASPVQAPMPAISGGQAQASVPAPAQSPVSSGGEQSIYVQNLSLLSDADESSLLEQFEFMGPGT
jgi:TP901 family phage tail tape measure protein